MQTKYNNNQMKNKNKKIIQLLLSAQAVWVALSAPGVASANIIGSFSANADGTTTYTYVIDNSKGTFDVAAWSLDFGFSMPDWNQFDIFSGGSVNVPSLNWFADAGIPVTGQSAQDFLSLDSDGDVAGGQSLGGFSFTSAFQPGTVTYSEFSADGMSETGMTVGPSMTVPDKGSWLEGLALVGVVIAGKKIQASRHQPGSILVG